MHLTKLSEAFLRSAAYERRFLAKNHWDFSMVVWIPLATVLLIWWIFSQTQITDLPIGVIDQDNSAVANTAVRYLEASPTLTVRQLYYSQADAEAAILQRDIYAVVIIPEDFSRNILSSQPAPLTLQVNAQYGTHSGIIQAGVQAVASTLSAGVEIKRLIKQGVAPSQAMTAYAPISVQRISLFNAATNYQQFLASTVIPALLHILAMVIGATTIGRELRDKNIGRWYRFIDTGKPSPTLSKTSKTTSSLSTKQDSSNNKASSSSANVPHSVSLSVLVFGLLGKYFWPILAYSLWSALILWLATSNQSINIMSLMAVYAGFLCLMVLSFWLGAIFTLNSFSLRMGLSTTGFISAPSYAFAGVTFPYIAISDSAQYWSNALPLTHYLKLHIAQLQMQAPMAISLPIVYGLMFAVIIALILAALLTKRALAHPERWGAR
ncbi:MULTISPECIES: ABC transporter permease [Psychrobacter]|jgi:ABC-2 type transport system permease protein|uniref:ABC transporter permease n=1 Tax=Psychrobacter TaxID=497 RepID=UPI000C32777C|nr:MULTISPECIES: ABC transporter permease [Psychrobacter]MBA6245360.1 ABC transporter permease [Psychrobacter sp. Urea-trap-18]MBA6286898.1 ABC transporter permease [Psychrobacter sp. Urea-trap-16]MBA6317920.1 ABC transporter permease [Psychrobacter sp. Urea-trap-20]MBA6335165.1 ABC transporter permease [Psychrobacter sp. Urea-trap-19]PKG60480.1 ABC transporter permease [Psychrobacter sp. Choline-3u-12]